MMTILMVLTVWFAGLGAYVALKLRQPHLGYPAPPLSRGNFTKAA